MSKADYFHTMDPAIEEAVRTGDPDRIREAYEGSTDPVIRNAANLTMRINRLMRSMIVCTCAVHKALPKASAITEELTIRFVTDRILQAIFEESDSESDALALTVLKTRDLVEEILRRSHHLDD